MWYGETVVGIRHSLQNQYLPLAALLVGAVFLSGCAPEVRERIVYRDRPVEVKVPMAVMPEVPPYLQRDVFRPQLQWQAPGPDAPVCLSNADAEILRTAVWGWLTRLEAWERWAAPTE